MEDIYLKAKLRRYVSTLLIKRRNIKLKKRGRIGFIFEGVRYVKNECSLTVDEIVALDQEYHFIEEWFRYYGSKEYGIEDYEKFVNHSVSYIQKQGGNIEQMDEAALQEEYDKEYLIVSDKQIRQFIKNEVITSNSALPTPRGLREMWHELFVEKGISRDWQEVLIAHIMAYVVCRLSKRTSEDVNDLIVRVFHSSIGQKIMDINNAYCFKRLSKTVQEVKKSLV